MNIFPIGYSLFAVGYSLVPIGTCWLAGLLAVLACRACVICLLYCADKAGILEGLAYWKAWG